MHRNIYKNYLTLTVVTERDTTFLKGVPMSLTRFQWQSGYGAFSIGRSEVNTVEKYIRNQDEHHKIKTYKEEYLHFINDYEIEYDERYLWD
jgi:putative transposase